MSSSVPSARRTGRVRLWIAAGAALSCAVVWTGANVVHTVDGKAVIAADQDFDLQVSGLEQGSPGTPTWVQGNPTPQAVAVTKAGKGFGPGDSKTFTVGVRNASTELSGNVDVSVVDPDPEDEDLFHHLHFTLSRGDTVLLDSVSGEDPSALAELDLGRLDPSDAATLTLTVTLPDDAGNEAQGIGTRIQVDFKGESL